MMQDVLHDGLPKLASRLHGLGRQQVADQVADAEKLAEWVGVADRVLLGVGVQVQAARKPERVGREVASPLRVEAAPAVLVQATLLVVVLAGQAVLYQGGFEVDGPIAILILYRFGINALELSLQFLGVGFSFRICISLRRAFRGHDPDHK